MKYLSTIGIDDFRLYVFLSSEYHIMDSASKPVYQRVATGYFQVF